ncbi:MAG: hypothetical protein NC911_04540 [Candidatus Omnitrophica bacterium]|nr:hypothetical protein [Candidatus Omnitrophota bacterium]
MERPHYSSLIPGWKNHETGVKRLNLKTIFCGQNDKTNVDVYAELV